MVSQTHARLAAYRPGLGVLEPRFLTFPIFSLNSLCFSNLGGILTAPYIPTPQLPVRVSQVTNVARDGAWRVELTHAHDFHRIILFTRGQGRVTFGAKHRSYGPNSVLFLPANTPYSFEIRGHVFGTIVDIASLDLLTMPAAPIHLRIRNMSEQTQLMGLVEHLQSELNEDAIGQTRACVFYAGLLGVWLERAAVTAPPRPHENKSAADLVVRFQNMVESRFATGDNVSAYAKALGVTPTHLTRCCQTCLGQSSLSILNERILYEARDLLTSTSLPIKDVAQALGYTSAAYFTRAFQSATGQTPSDFRAR